MDPKKCILKKCIEEGSNLQPPGSKPGTLSIELSVLIETVMIVDVPIFSQ